MIKHNNKEVLRKVFCVSGHCYSQKARDGHGIPLSYWSGRPQWPPEMHKLSQTLLISCDCDFGKPTQPRLALGKRLSEGAPAATLPCEYACEEFS